MSVSTPIVGRLETLVVARAHANGRACSLRELLQPLARFAPTTVTASGWHEQLSHIAAELVASSILTADHRLADPAQLARRVGSHVGSHLGPSWPQLADRVLPGLALGIAASDTKAHARLAGRDAWAAAIVGRALGLWSDGAPPSLAALCDALAWRQLALAGKPKRCPPEIRAVFVQRELASEAGPPERLVRLLAAREVDAPRPELRTLRDALVRMWSCGRALGVERPFAFEVRSVASATEDGRFGDHKVFIASVWRALRRSPSWAQLTLDEFKARLIAAHRAGDLALARADLVAAMDPELVAASETTTDGASFHFIVREATA